MALKLNKWDETPDSKAAWAKYQTAASTPYTDSAELTKLGQQKNAMLTTLGSTSWNGGKYQQQLDDSMQKIINRQPFEYDLNGDMLYQQYKNQYTREGKRAMQDTIGQAAALTGGYGNSYAETAGAQAYYNQLDKLNDKVPELYQLAMQRYQMEGDQLKDAYGLLTDAYGREYGEFNDAYNRNTNLYGMLSDAYWNGRNFDYGVYSDNVNRLGDVAGTLYDKGFKAWGANNDVATAEYNAQQQEEQNAADLALQYAKLSEDQRQFDISQANKQTGGSGGGGGGDPTYKLADYNSIDEDAAEYAGDPDALFDYLTAMVGSGFISQNQMDVIYRKYRNKQSTKKKTDGVASQGRFSNQAYNTYQGGSVDKYPWK